MDKVKYMPPVRPELRDVKGRKFPIELSLTARPLVYQLSKSGLLKNTLIQFDRDVDAINRLCVHGLITEMETRHARRRLLKKIKTAFEKEVLHG